MSEVQKTDIVYEFLKANNAKLEKKGPCGQDIYSINPGGMINTYKVKGDQYGTRIVFQGQMGDKWHKQFIDYMKYRQKWQNERKLGSEEVSTNSQQCTRDESDNNNGESLVALIIRVEQLEQKYAHNDQLMQRELLKSQKKVEQELKAAKLEYERYLKTYSERQVPESGNTSNWGLTKYRSYIIGLISIAIGLWWVIWQKVEKGS